MRAFADGFYNNLKAMYDYLGVQYHAQPFLFSFSKADTGNMPIGKGPKSPYFIHSSNNHKIPPLQPEGVPTAAWIVEILYLIVCYTWWTVCCFFITARSGSRESECETLEEYVRRIRLPWYFTRYYLLPLISSVTTCSHEKLLRFPAADLTEYKKMTHGAQHYTATNGIHSVQNKLAEGIDVRLSAVVLSVEPRDSRVSIIWTDAQDTQKLSSAEELFDIAILAVSPDVVGKIFQPLQREMARIPTLTVESIVHTDHSTIRVSPGAFSTKMERFSHNTAQTIHLRTSTEDIHRTESIHVQPSGAVVTTCPFTPVDPALIIQSSRFTRVLRTPESRRIVNTIFSDNSEGNLNDEKSQSKWKNGENGVWLVGGWCWDGMVLLEGCIVSAMRLADSFGVDIPWRDDGTVEAHNS